MEEPMRTLATTATLAALLLLPAACTSVERPSTDAIKAVRVLENPDVRTLHLFGQVQFQGTYRGDHRLFEEAAYDALRARALEQYPDANVLFAVRVTPGDTAGLYSASAIAARRRGT
jgi:hypothetical protein